MSQWPIRVMLTDNIKRCPHCGYQGKAVREGGCLVWVAALAWLVPLGFLSLGYWPFFLLPAVALTAWAWIAARSLCPACGARWKG